VIRVALWLAGGAILGGIVHLSTVLLLPRAATQDAYSRLSPMASVNSVVLLPAPAPDGSVLPFMDPAFATAVCRYDLTAAPLKLTAPVSLLYTSVSLYTRNGVAYYAINDRAAGHRTIEFDLMTAEQHSQLPEEEDVTAADRLIVDSPTPTGLIVLRALASEPGLMPSAVGTLMQARCRPNPMLK
jgi:uncharacterized membrane protein